MKTISVFGGSHPRPGSPAYREALQLGSLLGNAGYAVQTGGYIGTMEAVSRGAAEAGGHVIGVTCDEIESWRPVGPNSWLREEKRCPTLKDRLHVLIEDCDGAIALPGGIGTLAEIALSWAQFQLRPEERKPLIVVGPGWDQILKTFQAQLGEYIPAADQTRITRVQDVDSVLDILQRSLE